MSGRILVFADAQGSGRVLEARLSAECHTVELVLAGAERRMAAAEPPELVLVDAVAPGSEAWRAGLDFTRVAAGRPAPLLVLSRRDDPVGRLAALRAGAADMVAQPVTSEQVLAMVRALLRHRRVSDEEQARAATARALGAGEAGASAGAKTGGRALLIDDDPAGAAVLAARLEAAGIRVEPAGPAELVVLGLDLAGEDALAVLARLRAAAETRETPVVVIASPGSADRVARAYEFGADDCCYRAAPAREFVARARRLVAAGRERRAGRLDPARAEALGLREPATGLATERFLACHLARRLGAEPPGEVGLVLAELDDPGGLAERFGAAATAGVLAAVARGIGGCVRGIDLVARYRAAGLAVMVPGADAAEAAAVAERVRLAISALVVEPLAGEPCQVKASVAGVARGGRMVGGPALLAEAEAALAKARRAGRTRCDGKPLLRAVAEGRRRA